MLRTLGLLELPTRPFSRPVCSQRPQGSKFGYHGTLLESPALEIAERPCRLENHLGGTSFFSSFPFYQLEANPFPPDLGLRAWIWLLIRFLRKVFDKSN